jgi:uncharacterized protein (DUF488 family)
MPVTSGTQTNPMPDTAPPPPAVYSIGHSNQPVEALVELLRRHAIDVLVDVRSQPYSRWATQFNQGPLLHAARAAGVRYEFFGSELGGRPPESQYYDAEGHVLYDRVAASQRFVDGVDRLLRDLAGCRIAMMCSEEDPAVCHRYLLIAPVLADRGIVVRHIRGDGSLQADDELRAEAARAKDGGQQLLFETQEAPPWRSLRSVLPKSGPPSSSAP